MVNAIVNERNLFPRDAKEIHDITSRVIPDGDEGVLPVRELPNNHPRIKHPRPIIFFGHAEGREIVDGSHQAAGLWPQQAPITWDVENVQLMLSRQSRQSSLIHNDVLDRWV